MGCCHLCYCTSGRAGSYFDFLYSEHENNSQSPSDGELFLKKKPPLFGELVRYLNYWNCQDRLWPI